MPVPVATLCDESNCSEHTIVLRFISHGARWAAVVEWHPDQAGHWPRTGEYELRVPYRHAEELVRDVLAYGPGAQVLGPDTLRERIGEYESTWGGHA